MTNNINDYILDVEIKDNIWFPKTSTPASYPKDGNETFFQIEDKSFWFKHRNNCIISALNVFFPQNISFFEIGGGNGYVSSAIQKNGNNVFFVEPDIKGILNAQKRGLENLICASFNDIHFNENTIPAIGVFDVLEHIRNDTEFIKKINSILIHNGLLILTVPAYNFLWSSEDSHDGHFRRYSKNKLNKLLKKNGFDILYSTYFFRILPLPIFIIRTIPSLLGVKRKYIVDEYLKENKEPIGLVKKTLNFSFSKELKNIENKKQMNFGGSILIIAKKI
ncbi:MAG: hypothetical protein A2046_04790 [Bacteroidetes bacterium GWA2_30_7]|nr:MAG: hypothetical protein A2046_04790 [Bacteroidetes bacterium GWA2_30_7]